MDENFKNPRVPVERNRRENFDERMPGGSAVENNRHGALDIQIGGNHYKDAAIQPVEFILFNRLGFLEGCIIKRVYRHDKPSGKGIEDLRKVIHEAQLLAKLLYNTEI